MHPRVLIAFSDEMQKLAGVGWDVHGYTAEDPEKAVEHLSAPSEEWNKKYREAVGAFPRIPLKRTFPLFGRKVQKKTPEYLRQKEEYDSRARAFVSNNPSPGDPYDAKRDLRVKTPFDSKTNYKLNDTIAGNGNEKLWDYTTDQSYSSTPVVRNLSKEEARRALDLYRQSARGYLESAAPEMRSHIREQAQAFVNKTEYLLKDPAVKTIRLEYE